MELQRISCRIGTAALIVIALAGCEKKTDRSPQPDIAVANSYLAAVVRDLGVESSKVMTFVPPGMCPAHFDLTPSQANRLLSCSVLLVFDFQNQIVSSLPRIQESGLQVCVIAPPPGLCVPDSYLSVARQVEAALDSVNAKLVPDTANRMPVIEERMKVLDRTMRNEMDKAGLRETAVLVSKHQEVFARWLGLNPIGTFRGSDTETPGSIQSALENAAKQPIQRVIANRQEGTELAQSLAGRLSARLVAFGNFPETNDDEGNQPAFDLLVSNNLRRLIEAAP
jgi:zinc transport system substrate-binding protein